MTIRRGEPWGSSGPLAPGRPVFTNDAELGTYVCAARQDGLPLGEVGLTGGDLAATLGITAGTAVDRPGRLYEQDRLRVPIDVVAVTVDDRPGWFVAHLIAHRRGWRGHCAVAMNAEWWGRFKLGPRCHPNDGLIDITQGRLALLDRLKARARASHGLHLPHPALQVSRAPAAQLTFPTPTPVWLDGRSWGRARAVSLTVEPDALVVVV